MEEQSEEYEVLDSIYGSGDDRFKSIGQTVFQYKFGEDGDTTSFLLEIRWPQEYPTVIPEYNLDVFFNQHLSNAAKSAILRLVSDESENYIGSVQTYTMIEWIRDNYEKITEIIKSTSSISSNSQDITEESYSKDTFNSSNQSKATTKVKKEQLTKSQKRKELDRTDAKGEKIRGHDWVDVIKHLSQGGHQTN